jgi:predicted O-linked N-acetylglucosamine transferase (SPINDLY family)
MPDPADHLARLRLADLFLDTLPYNAHATACDALWAGLPVLTCSGPTFTSRVAGSLLQAIGVPELTVESLNAYEKLACELANDRARLATLRARLSSPDARSGLFDTDLLRRELEWAYGAMWERCIHGEAASDFAVPRL